MTCVLSLSCENAYFLLTREHFESMVLDLAIVSVHADLNLCLVCLLTFCESEKPASNEHQESRKGFPLHPSWGVGGEIEAGSLAHL